MVIKEITLGQLETIEKTSVIVVVDVLRAFTTAAYAFAAGAKEIIMVGTIQEAFALKQTHLKAILVGENYGRFIPGFHFGNSPFEIAKENLEGKTVIQRTSAGSQGVVNAYGKADTLLIASFVNAEGTVKKIIEIDPEEIVFVVTGSKDGSEDRALVHYLSHRVKGVAIDPKPYLDKVKNSPDGRSIAQSNLRGCPKEDLDLVCQLDAFSFSMQVFEKDGLSIVRPLT